MEIRKVNYELNFAISIFYFFIISISNYVIIGYGGFSEIVSPFLSILRGMKKAKTNIDSIKIFKTSSKYITPEKGIFLKFGILSPQCVCGRGKGGGGRISKLLVPLGIKILVSKNLKWL